MFGGGPSALARHRAARVPRAARERERPVGRDGGPQRLAQLRPPVLGEGRDVRAGGADVERSYGYTYGRYTSEPAWPSLDLPNGHGNGADAAAAISSGGWFRTQG